MSKKIMPTQIPDEASEAGFQAWTKTAGVNEVIAAAINSWPNVNNNYLAKDNRGAPINAIILPLPQEKIMTDIVNILRSVTEDDAYARPWTFRCHCMEAADEIERLRNLVKKLATALEFEANYEPHMALARAALEGK